MVKTYNQVFCRDSYLTKENVVGKDKICRSSKMPCSFSHPKTKKPYNQKGHRAYNYTKCDYYSIKNENEPPPFPLSPHYEDQQKQESYLHPPPHLP